MPNNPTDPSSESYHPPPPQATTNPNPNPTPTGPSIPTHQASTLLTSFSSFLTIAIHSLLYHRNLYPATSFLTARAFNLPVHQSRHPGVCAWVNDAISAITAQLHVGAVRRVVFVVHGLDPKREVLERWVFDVQSFPAWGKKGDKILGGSHRREDGAPAPAPVSAQAQPSEQASGEAAADGVNWTDVNEALRGTLLRLAHRAQGMEPLPDGCTFTLAVELREDAPAPIGHPQPWIPSESNLQPPTKDRPNQGSSLGGASTLPVRSVRADPLFFECWVEQGAADTTSSNTSTSTTQHHSSS